MCCRIDTVNDFFETDLFFLEVLAFSLSNKNTTKQSLLLNCSVCNVCFINIRSKHNIVTLLSLLRIFMKQTLVLSANCHVHNPVIYTYSVQRIPPFYGISK